MSLVHRIFKNGTWTAAERTKVEHLLKYYKLERVTKIQADEVVISSPPDMTPAKLKTTLKNLRRALEADEKNEKSFAYGPSFKYADWEGPFFAPDGRREKDGGRSSGRLSDLIKELDDLSEKNGKRPSKQALRLRNLLGKADQGQDLEQVIKDLDAIANDPQDDPLASIAARAIPLARQICPGE